MEDKIRNFCKKWKIKEFSFFGSINTDKFNSGSDIDVIVTFDDNSSIGFFELSEMKDELEMLTNRHVDILTKRGVQQSTNEIRKRSILESMKLVYSEN
jgi:predicted nucleotidyltransferase